MGPTPGFSASCNTTDGVARIALRGELDGATFQILEAHLARLEDDNALTIMLDLQELTFIDSCGLRTFLLAKGRATANNHQLVLVGASASARRLFDLTGTLSLLDAPETA